MDKIEKTLFQAARAATGGELSPAEESLYKEAVNAVDIYTSGDAAEGLAYFASVLLDAANMLRGNKNCFSIKMGK